MEVDWAGDTISVFDPVTGEEEGAYLFIAVLPCSFHCRLGGAEAAWAPAAER